MARIFGTVLILAGCAGFLYKWAEGEKARQRMAGEWIRLFVRWGYALEQEHVRLYDFLSFYETADASMQAFLDEVCVCMRNHQNPSGQKIWQDCLQKHKRELHFMAKAVQRICDAMKSAENGWKNFWQSHDWNFLKNSGCICLLEC